MKRTSLQSSLYKRWIVSLCLPAVLFFPSYTYGADACRAVVVRSADLQPHLDVVRGIRAASSCLVREITIGENERAEKIMTRAPGIAIAVGTAGLRKLREIASIPVVYAMAVPSEALRYRGGNISGVSMDLAPERYFEAMHDLFPDRKRVGIVYDPERTGAYVEDAVKSSRAAGFELVLQPIADASKLNTALDALQKRIDILWMLPDATVLGGENTELLLRFSFRETVPIFTFSRKYAEMGAVVALSLDPYDIGVQTGELSNKVLGGALPAFEYARTGLVTVNSRVAGKMGLHPAQKGLRRATTID